MRTRVRPRVGHNRAVSKPFYLVRHGESEWNVRRLTQGQAKHPRLTPAGRAQAVRAAAKLADDLTSSGLRVDDVLTSDLTRAVETARVVVRTVGGRLRVDQRLREQHLGDLEGRCFDETFAVADTVDWSTPDQPIAGGESLRQVYDRVVGLLAGLDPLLVYVLVGHGGSIRASLAHLRGVEPHRTEWEDIPNGAIARCGWSGEVVWL